MLNFVFGIMAGSSVSFLIFSVFSVSRVKVTDDKLDNDLEQKGTNNE